MYKSAIDRHEATTACVPIRSVLFPAVGDNLQLVSLDSKSWCRLDTAYSTFAAPVAGCRDYAETLILTLPTGWRCPAVRRYDD